MSLPFLKTFENQTRDEAPEEGRGDDRQCIYRENDKMFKHLEVPKSHPLVLLVKVVGRKGLVSESEVFGEGAGRGEGR